jgi:hypothetical protein
LQEILTYSVSGLVTDKNSVAIKNALVKIAGTNLSASTVENGSYSITGVPEGDYEITASAQGFADATRSISVSTSNLTDVNFSLTPVNTSSINLTASGYKVKGIQTVDLVWSGATSSVTILRNNTPIATVSGTSYKDNIGKVGGGTYVYQVYEGNIYSNQATVVF